MNALRNHLRNKCLAGALAAGPFVVLVVTALWLEENTRWLTKPLGFHLPGLGIVLALVGVYLLGLLVTSLIGSFFLRLLDYLLDRLPGLNLLYRAWKDILVMPAGKAGVFHKVVLIPAAEEHGAQMGFTSAEPLPGDPESICVFVPGAPNPLSGQLVMVKRSACLLLDLPIEEAFKCLLSTGKFVPTMLQGSTVSSKPAAVDAPS
jgi:uncharacterized membrane protein